MVGASEGDSIGGQEGQNKDLVRAIEGRDLTIAIVYM